MQFEARTFKRRGRPLAGGAQILFFTGVRYSRMEEPPTSTGDAPQGVSRGKPRKRRARA
jgi:hypothetical protein